MKNSIIRAALLFCLPLSMTAQETIEIPSLADMSGSFVIINSKTYEEVTSVSEVRGMEFTVTADDSIQVDNFYMGGIQFKASYNEATGNFSIKAGTKVFAYSDGQGSVQYLYAWDEEEQEVILRPVTYRYRGGGVWENTQPLVLMTGDAAGGDLQPYYFSQGSKIVRANGTTTNVTYDGEAQRFDESRPSYVLMSGDNILIYNLLQKDSYGYGCWLTLTYDREAGKVYSNPALIGSATAIDYPYKALTGCEYDADTHRPTNISNAGTAYAGRIEGTFNEETGVIEFSPMAVWPSKYDEEGWIIDNSRFYEVEESVTVTFDVEAASTGIQSPEVSGEEGKQVLSVEFYNLMGQRTAAPLKGEVMIVKTLFKDGTFKTEKKFFKQ